jgi:hypothetical protein
MSARPYWNERADGRNVCGKGSTPVHLLLPLRVWKRLLAAGMLFCLGAQAAEKRNLDDIRNALWQDSDDVSLREMLAALGEAGEKNLSVTFAGVFCETCRRADADALEDLVRIFEAFPPESYQKGVLFTPLADAWLRVRISPKLPQRPVFPDAPTKLPEASDGYPRELREAALEYERVRGPFRALQEGKVDFQTHQPAYWKLVARLLEQKEGPWSDGFLAYRWGGKCGSGSEYFIVPQSRVLVMALAADQRWTEVAGAVLAIMPSADPDGALRVLEACVADPLKVVVGGLAYFDLGPRGFLTLKLRATLLGFLLRLSGDGRVQALTDLAAHAPVEALPLYFMALGKFVTSSTAPDPGERAGSYGRWGGKNLDGITARTASTAAQKQALDFLCSRASPDLPIEAATRLAEIFHAKPRPEALPALRRLLDHPSLTVAREAAAALEFAGEKADIPPKLGPVRYRIEVNGKPYAARRVEWIVSWGATSMWTSSEETTDAQGVAHLPRDMFLDKSSRPIKQVTLRSPAKLGLEDALFSVQLPPPPDSDDVIPISVKTKPL